MNKSLLLVVCFLIGIFIFLLLNRYCECKVVEGSVKGDEPLITGQVYAGDSKELWMADLISQFFKNGENITNYGPGTIFGIEPYHAWDFNLREGNTIFFAPPESPNTTPRVVEFEESLRRVDGDGLSTSPSTEIEIVSAVPSKLIFNIKFRDIQAAEVSQNIEINSIWRAAVALCGDNTTTWKLHHVISKIIEEFNGLLDKYIESLFGGNWPYTALVRDNAVYGQFPPIKSYKELVKDQYKRYLSGGTPKDMIQENMSINDFTHHMIPLAIFIELAVAPTNNELTDAYLNEIFVKPRPHEVPPAVPTDDKNIMLFMKNAYGGVDVESLSYCLSSQEFPPYTEILLGEKPSMDLKSTQERHRKIIYNYLTSLATPAHQSTTIVNTAWKRSVVGGDFNPTHEFFQIRRI